MLAGDPASDGVLEYRGGVLYAEFGVAGRELGGRPSSFRWAGVRGMSERSSFGRTRGSNAKAMLIKGTRTTVAYIQPLYCCRTELTLARRLVPCVVATSLWGY
jgi:hypothetical protein